MSTEEDDLLTREAAAELAEDAKRGKSRTKALGSLAWQRRNVSTLDKRYLTNTIIGAVQSNKRKETKTTRELSASNKRKETKTIREPFTQSRRIASTGSSRIFGNALKATSRHEPRDEKKVKYENTVKDMKIRTSYDKRRFERQSTSDCKEETDKKKKR